jgi:hypothetical protein
MNMAHINTQVRKSIDFFMPTCLLVLASGSLPTASAAAASIRPVQQTIPESHRIIVKLRPEAMGGDQFGSNSLQTLITRLDVRSIAPLFPDEPGIASADIRLDLTGFTSSSSLNQPMSPTR